jgi:hypothetical protein
MKAGLRAWTPVSSRLIHRKGGRIKLLNRKDWRTGRCCTRLVLTLLWIGLGLVPGPVEAARLSPAGGSSAPALVNGAFECSQGFAPQAGVNGNVPAGWTAVLLNGYPRVNSTNLEFAYDCGDYDFEKIEGQDSWVFLSQDIETPPEPGKPFDAAVYQRVTVTPGAAYSLSGWMLSLCGGSTMPNDCPLDSYMSKMLGIDPTGGTNPLAPTVIWVEDQRNFTEARWVNLRMGATAQSTTLTVFARIRSPFQWHGNHAFVDAYSLVRAPTAAFVDLPATVQGLRTTVRWTGVQSPDIAAIPGGTYQLLFDVQYRRAGEAGWTDWQTGQPTGEALFTAGGGQTQTYEFRLRARSEQPPAPPDGAWPNHRYPGDWSAPASVQFVAGSFPPRAYLPWLRR